jgi:hypothetical protein
MKAGQSGHRGVYWEPNPRGTREVRQPTGGRVRGDWWICWACPKGHRAHREKVGPKSLAVQQVERRRTQVLLEGFCLTETKRVRVVPFSEVVEDYVQHQKAHNRHPHNDCTRVQYWKDRWGERPVADITRQDVEAGKASPHGPTRPQANTGPSRVQAGVQARYGESLRGGAPSLLQRGDPQRQGREQSGSRHSIPTREQRSAEVPSLPGSRASPARRRAGLPAPGDG